MIKKHSKDITKHAHIISVLNVIRNINQLIVREKEVEKLRIVAHRL